ncbi:MAG: DUF2911 domain-containing protein [Bacteroidota bacterium]
MKIANITKGLLLAFSLSLITIVSWGQRSPKMEAHGTINGANLVIKYNAPLVKGRVIYGGLVPYGKVWRAGADTATRFYTDKDIKVEGKTLAAGAYSVYAIPGETEWVIIFNSKTGQWGINRDGTTTEDPALDVLRVTVKPRKSATMNENLAYTFNGKGFVLSWENLEVPVSIK